MSTNVGPPFFSGWAGFGQDFSGLLLSEPSDQSYARRPIVYGPLSGGLAEDVSTGTIGPASTAWVNLSFVGLFDAPSAGNLLSVIPLDRPVTVSPGHTLTTSRRFSFRLALIGSNSTVVAASWVAGTQIGTTTAGAAVINGCNVQIQQGVMSAIGGSPGLPALSGLPSIQPVAGSGVLWNNGGVICIA